MHHVQQAAFGFDPVSFPGDFQRHIHFQIFIHRNFIKISMQHAMRDRFELVFLNQAIHFILSGNRSIRRLYFHPIANAESERFLSDLLPMKRPLCDDRTKWRELFLTLSIYDSNPFPVVFTVHCAFVTVNLFHSKFILESFPGSGVQ